MTLIAGQQLANGRLTVGQWLADNIAWELFFTFTQNLKYSTNAKILKNMTSLCMSLCKCSTVDVVYFLKSFL